MKKLMLAHKIPLFPVKRCRFYRSSNLSKHILMIHNQEDVHQGTNKIESNQAITLPMVVYNDV